MSVRGRRDGAGNEMIFEVCQGASIDLLFQFRNVILFFFFSFFRTLALTALSCTYEKK